MQDRDSRFVVACATSPLNEDLIERAVGTTVERTHQRELHWWSSGWQGYQHILVRAYLDWQTGTSCVGRRRDAHIDANDQTSR